MSLVRFQSVTKKYETRLVLRDVSFRLSAGERVGLVGKNGTGKTTILRLILMKEEPTEGKVDVTPGTRIGYFSQFSEMDGAASVQTVLEDLFADVRAVEDELNALNTSLETVTDDTEMEVLLGRQAHLFEEMNRNDGWEYARHIDTVLTKLGFNETRRAQPVSELSGGWRNRASLAKILLEDPDVLLLDEPTNFLDVEGLAWLESWLATFRGGLLLVSHDRQFLNGVVTRIAELENYHLHDYEGSYTEFVRAKPFRAKSLERQFAHEEELLTLEAEAISDRQELAKNPSAGTARKLADIKKRRPPRPIDLIVTSIYQGLRVPDKLCRFESLTKSYNGVTLFQDVTFEIEREERLAIVGPNGSGKSTLLRLLTGEEKPDSGEVTWERGVRYCRFQSGAAGVGLDGYGRSCRERQRHGLQRHAQRGRPFSNPFTVLRGGFDPEDRDALRRPAGASRARPVPAFRRGGADLRRADQPPRLDQHAGHGTGVDPFSRRGHRRQPRPVFSRQDRDASSRVRAGRDAHGVPGELDSVAGGNDEGGFGRKIAGNLFRVKGSSE